MTATAGERRKRLVSISSGGSFWDRLVFSPHSSEVAAQRKDRVPHPGNWATRRTASRVGRWGPAGTEGLEYKSRSCATGFQTPKREKFIPKTLKSAVRLLQRNGDFWVQISIPKKEQLTLRSVIQIRSSSCDRSGGRGEAVDQWNIGLTIANESGRNILWGIRTAWFSTGFSAGR